MCCVVHGIESPITTEAYTDVVKEHAEAADVSNFVSTGACPYNRPCAQQYVGKSQSCMVVSGRLYGHAPVALYLVAERVRAGASSN